MYGSQHIAVTGDFLLIAVTRLDFFLDQSIQTLVSRIDSLDAVGCSCTLDFGNLKQGCEDISLGLDEKFLSAPAFMQARENTDHFWREKVFGEVYEVKLVHIASLFHYKCT